VESILRSDDSYVVSRKGEGYHRSRVVGFKNSGTRLMFRLFRPTTELLFKALTLDAIEKGVTCSRSKNPGTRMVFCSAPFDGRASL
jgi:hypothetical protein